MSASFHFFKHITPVGDDGLDKEFMVDHYHVSFCNNNMRHVLEALCYEPDLSGEKTYSVIALLVRLDPHRDNHSPQHEDMTHRFHLIRKAAEYAHSHGYTNFLVA